MTLNLLSERRKADRMTMARLLLNAVAGAGATGEIIEQAKVVYPDGSGDPKSREVYVKITAPGGAHISVEFDGDTTQPGVFVDTWQGPRDGIHWLHPRLGDVNPHHWSKLNRVCYGLADLIETLTHDVERFADGSGYMTVDDPRIIKMKARWNEEL